MVGFATLNHQWHSTNDSMVLTRNWDVGAKGKVSQDPRRFCLVRNSSLDTGSSRSSRRGLPDVVG